jgi:hypothetical protein
MIDLTTLDPATLQPSAQWDAFVHEHWMGLGPIFASSAPCYSTDSAIAGEARRRAGVSSVRHYLTDVWVFLDEFYGVCDYAETNGDKGLAEALATSRAIGAWAKARNQ